MRTLILGLIALLGFAGFGTKNSVTSYSESTNREYEIFIWTASQNEEILGE
jgi:ABC-type glycerol-3-phosphate transport system substrate-binding protein